MVVAAAAAVAAGLATGATLPLQHEEGTAPLTESRLGSKAHRSQGAGGHKQQRQIEDYLPRPPNSNLRFGRGITIAVGVEAGSHIHGRIVCATGCCRGGTCRHLVKGV